MENNNEELNRQIVSDDDHLRNFCKHMTSGGKFCGGDTVPNDFHDTLFERLKEDEYGTTDAIIKHVKEG